MSYAAGIRSILRLKGLDGLKPLVKEYKKFDKNNYQHITIFCVLARESGYNPDNTGYESIKSLCQEIKLPINKRNDIKDIYDKVMKRLKVEKDPSDPLVTIPACQRRKSLLIRKAKEFAKSKGIRFGVMKKKMRKRNDYFPTIKDGDNKYLILYKRGILSMKKVDNF